MKTLVPPPPLFGAVGEEKHGESSKAPRAERSSFGAGFLVRTYRSMLFVGLAATFLAALGTRSLLGTWSVIAGLLLAAGMLRVQEVSVRGALRPGSDASDLGAKALVVFLLPLKLVAIGVLVWLAQARGWIGIVPFGVGFFAGQLVIVARLVGWLVNRTQARK